MRKMCAWFVAFALLFSLSACAAEVTQQSDPQAEPAQDGVQEPAAQSPVETPEEEPDAAPAETPEVEPAQPDTALQEVFAEFLALEFWQMTPEAFETYLLEQGWTAYRDEEGVLEGYLFQVAGQPLMLELQLREDGAACERLYLGRGLCTEGYAGLLESAESLNPANQAFLRDSSVVTEDFPTEMVCWLASARGALALAPAALTTRSVCLPAADTALAELFRADFDELRAQDSLNFGLYTNEGWYAVNSGAAAAIQFGRTIPERTEDDPEARDLFVSCGLSLCAPDYRDSQGLSPLFVTTPGAHTIELAEYEPHGA